MTERAKLQRQIEELQDQVASLQERIDDRYALSMRPQVWLARTVDELISGETESGEREYPAASSSTFPVRFRRPKFRERVGDQKLEGPFGDRDAQRYALTVPKRFVPNETDKFVVEIDGQFYFLPDSAREVLVVELDEDLPAAQKTNTGSSSTPGQDPLAECLTAPQVGAKIWSKEKGYWCPTGRRIDAPEGVYNFQTDKEHKAQKSGGLPNLMLVYREAESGVWVPECSTCDAPSTPSSLACACLSDESMCQVFLHFRDVGQVGLGTEIDGQVWPNYCRWVVVPGTGMQSICGAGCSLWGRSLGWELEEELSPTTIDGCIYGMYQQGAPRTFGGNFNTTQQYPCANDGDVTGFVAEFTCPEPTDGTGTAKVDFWIRECLIMQLWFDDVRFDSPDSPARPQQFDTENRVSRITFPSVDLSDPSDPNDRCICLVETTRLDKACGGFNANTGTPNLQDGAPDGPISPPDAGGNCFDANGDFDPTCANAPRCPGISYVVTTAGTHDFGGGHSEDLEINDTVVYDDITWKWVVIRRNATGGVNRHEVAPVEVKRVIDSDGCDWTDTLKNALVTLQFKECE